MTFERAKEELRKLGYYLREPDPEFDPSHTKYLLETYAGGYALHTDSLDDALKFAREKNKSVYFADDPRDIGGVGHETKSLTDIKNWARRVANESGKTVLIYISERGHSELYTTVRPGGRR